MSRVIALVITLSEITPPTVLELFMFMPYAALSIVFWIISPESFDMFKATPHDHCMPDTQSDFLSDCPNLPQEYCRISR